MVGGDRMEGKKTESPDTPLDHWTTDIDPSIMAGDGWVDEDDPGGRQAVGKEAAHGVQTGAIADRFMHPQHDVETAKE